MLLHSPAMTLDYQAITSADGIINAAKVLGSKYGPFKVAVAAEDDDVLKACAEAAELGFAFFTLLVPNQNCAKSVRSIRLTSPGLR